MNDNIIDRLEARSKELISKANDVIEARERLQGINEKLDTIPRIDDIIEAWDKYQHLMAGEWQRFGNSLLDGRFVESPELHKEGILLLSECRDLLLPYQELLSGIYLDFDLIRGKLNYFFVGYRDIDRYLDILEAFINEFESAKYEIEALTPKDNQRWVREQRQERRAPAAPRPRKQSKAAMRLQSQELQEVKSKLIAAGIIVDGVWQGTPAEFGCLVNELRDERGINDHGRRAWKEVAKWAGYDGNIESARSAIEKHIDTGGDVADNIRVICLANK